ncbi:MAG: hypothetical protein K0R28_4356 [Paenibacillus sp.]|nr:hypothetical protein [Paenibacillus sp.]
MDGVQLVSIEDLWLRWEQKLGISGCTRKQWLIRQQLSERNTTEYSIELEWAPADRGETDEEDGLNSPGTERPDLLTREEAFAHIEGHLTCKPYYVWDRGKGAYRFMHLVDCRRFVNAESGEVWDGL